jgi:hypothetical protein
MDLTNGILNVVTQIGLTFGLKKLYKPMFNKMLNKSFNAKACKELITAYRKDAKASNTAMLRKIEAKKELEKTKNTIYSAFSATMDIFVATILAKRCIVPFISTPITQYFTNKHNQKMEQQAKENGKENVQTPPKQEVEPPKSLDSQNTNLLAKYKQ